MRVRTKPQQHDAERLDLVLQAPAESSNQDAATCEEMLEFDVGLVRFWRAERSVAVHVALGHDEAELLPDFFVAMAEDPARYNHGRGPLVQG